MSKAVLEVNNLMTSFFTDNGEVAAVDDVSFYINEEKSLALSASLDAVSQ